MSEASPKKISRVLRSNNVQVGFKPLDTLRAASHGQRTNLSFYNQDVWSTKFKIQNNLQMKVKEKLNKRNSFMLKRTSSVSVQSTFDTMGANFTLHNRSSLTIKASLLGNVVSYLF